MVGWHHRLNGHEFEQTPGDVKGQPGVLQFMGSQRVEQNNNIYYINILTYFKQ